VGYLLVEKSLVLLLGGSEYVLRLFPLLCGAASIVLFARLVALVLDPLGASLALAFFVLAEPLVYYASEAKQYACDVTVCLALLLLSMTFLEGALSRRRSAALAVTGALAVWFSHPAAFVLGACGAVLLLSVLRDRDWSRLVALGAIFAAWTAGAAACWQVSFRHVAENPFLLSFWRPAFLPALLQRQPPYRVARDCLAALDLTPWNGALAALITCGAVSLFFRARRLLLAITLIVGLTLAVSYLHGYPLQRRFLLFWVPLAIILAAAGGSAVLRALARVRPELALIAALPVLGAPLAHAVGTLGGPRAVQELKPVLAYIKQQERPGDTIYVFHLAAYPFKYYAARFGFDDEFPLPPSYYDPDLPVHYAASVRREFVKPGFSSSIYLGAVSYFTSERLEDIRSDLEPLRGRRRVWVLLSHSMGGANVGSLLLAQLSRMGRRLDAFERPGQWGGSEAYLYDLGGGDGHG
jgi:hypothetical protein